MDIHVQESLLWTQVFISLGYMSGCGISATWDICVFHYGINFL